MNLVTVYRAYDLVEAELVRSRLEAAKFHPFIADQFSSLEWGGQAMTKQGVRVQVPEAEAADAQELLGTPGPAAE